MSFTNGRYENARRCAFPAALLFAAEQAVDIGARILRQGRAHLGALIAKGDRDFASDVDLHVEEAIKTSLARAAPDIPFLGEETGGDVRRRRRSGCSTRSMAPSTSRGTARCAQSRCRWSSPGNPSSGSSTRHFSASASSRVESSGAYLNGVQLTVPRGEASRGDGRAGGLQGGSGLGGGEPGASRRARALCAREPARAHARLRRARSRVACGGTAARDA